MQQLRKGIIAAIIAAMPGLAPAAAVPSVDQLEITGVKASTWRDQDANVILLNGPVHIEFDKVKMTSDAAVLWVSNPPGIVPDSQLVEIALIGNAKLEHSVAEARRTGDRLFVIARVRGSVRIVTPERLSIDRSNDEAFQAALSLRDQQGLVRTAEPGQWRMPRPSPFVELPRRKQDFSTPAEPVQRQAALSVGQAYTQRMPDGTIAVVVNKGLSVTLRNRAKKGNGSGADQVTQLTADRGVIFTNLRSLGNDADLQSGKGFADAVESIYLEGDVRVLYTPKSAKRPDSTLEAKHAFYEVATDRAVLTDAVIHTMDPGSRVPIVMRATTIKQLSHDDDRSEFRLQDSILTTSSFATPSYAVASEKAYVKQEASGDFYGMRTTYSGKYNTLDVWGVPVAWLPYAAGSVTERGFPLRGMDIGSSNRYGFYVMSEWGLFESIGRTPPKDVDMSYTVDYLGDRGPAGGLNAKYRGWSVSETTGQPSSYFGSLESFFVYDTGVDKFGSDRTDVTPPDEMRGRIKWEHQQFLPDDWQAQIKTGWISDSTFLEEYFPNEYNGIEAQDTSLYLKRQRDAEALTLLIETQPNNVVSTQEFAQENLEVERLPELGYHRLADNLNTQALTLYSSNTAGFLGYDPNQSNFAEMGYPGQSTSQTFPAGQSVEGFTGTTGGYVARGDFREELDFPITIDRYRVLPYILGRYTGYDNSPDGGSVNRGLGAAGVRVTSQFWKTDDQIASDRWDVHRLRHVVEPELHLFASAMNTQRQDVYVFDEAVDDVNDVSAAQVAIRQKWQTKRGGPGNWTNSDVVAWNLEGNFFLNQPDQTFDPSAPPGSTGAAGFDNSEAFLQPSGFRSIFMPSEPEASIPRNGINSDENWRISESTILLSDQSFNLDTGDLATNSIGLAAKRGDRTTYYIGERYINELNSNIVSFIINYELSTRYLLGLNQGYDFGDSSTVMSRFSLIRRFDTFYVLLSLTVDDTSGDTGFFVSIRPNYLPAAASTAIPAVINSNQ